MRISKVIALLLCMLIFVGLLCSCTGETGPQGPQGETGPQGPQGETGPAGKDGASFLTGKGQPSNELGEIGDSYLDLEGGEWGFYLKGEDGWELLGHIEVELPPPTLSDLNGSYVLSHIVTNTRTYHIGDEYYGLILSPDMIKAELNDGVGTLWVDFFNVASTNINCTIESGKLIMVCEDEINMTGDPASLYELSIVRDGETYLMLEWDGWHFYVKKIS